jgi:hypothetical protein
LEYLIGFIFFEPEQHSLIWYDGDLVVDAKGEVKVMTSFMIRVHSPSFAVKNSEWIGAAGRVALPW